MARLKEIYKKEIVPALTQQFGYKSVMEVPRLTHHGKSPVPLCLSTLGLDGAFASASTVQR